MMKEESPMRKKHYIAAVACIAAGAVGFAGVYATERISERKNETENVAEETQESAPASYEVLPQTAAAEEEEESENEVALLDTAETDQEEDASDAPDAQADEESQAASAELESLHFEKDASVWPVEGEVLLDYSMDSSIYFPTLEQYRYNPAMVIDAAVNDKVYSAAKGTITNISESEETGCTVTQDLGDGYTAVYGQLKELNFAVGDTVESGQVLGYVSEPTKYYSVEGSNVYFSLTKDGEAVDPKDYLPEMPMDTLE
jgi:murein DD-endopeptidase MepM/ murein hydrolase activator NlpD